MTVDRAFYRDLGARIRAHRLRAGFSQTKVAEALGVSFQQVQKYESGANRIPVDQLVVFAAHAGVPLEALLGAPAPLEQALGDDRRLLELVRAARRLTPGMFDAFLGLVRSVELLDVRGSA